MIRLIGIFLLCCFHRIKFMEQNNLKLAEQLLLPNGHNFRDKR